MGSEMCIRDRRYLKKARLQQGDIVELYCSVIRAAIEYCSPTYHSMLSEGMSDRIEKLQMKSLKTIFGWDKSYSDLLDLAGIETLKRRREKLVDNFAIKSSRNPRFDSWFPKAMPTGHNTRLNLPFQEEHARTKRYMNSPLFHMRRRLNQMSNENKMIDHNQF